MANRYWVGGTGNWSDDVNHWATSSGGSPGAGNLPTSSDDVFIDSNSGFGAGGTITLDGEYLSTVCKNFTSISGHSYSVEYGSSDIGIFGNAVFESTITWGSDTYQYFLAHDTGHTITANGCILYNLYFGDAGSNISDASGGYWTLQDNISIIYRFYQENGTLDANDHNVTANTFYFHADTGYTPTVIMGSGTWKATGFDDVWNIDQYNNEVVTIIPGTSTIEFTDTSFRSKNLIFADDTGNETHKAYNNFEFSGAGVLKILGSNIFNNFIVSSNPIRIGFEQLKTITVSSFNLTGTSLDLIAIDSVNSSKYFNGSPSSWSYPTLSDGGTGYEPDDILTANAGNQDFFWVVVSVDGSGNITDANPINTGSGYSISNGIELTGGHGSGAKFNIIGVNSVTGQFNLSKSSGTVRCDYLDISNSNATGGAKWYAGSNSFDVTNNDGWIFEDAPKTSVSSCQKVNLGLGGMLRL